MILNLSYCEIQRNILKNVSKFAYSMGVNGVWCGLFGPYWLVLYGQNSWSIFLNIFFSVVNDNFWVDYPFKRLLDQTACILIRKLEKA